VSATLPAPIAPLRGLVGYAVGTDHKSVAVRTFCTAFAFFLAGGILALLMRAELAAPGMQVTSRDGYDQLFTMHGSTMIYFFVTPVALALGTYLVPLQVGAGEIAAPRLNLVGFWLFVLGGVIAWSSFLTRNGAGAAAWTAEFPQSGPNPTPGTGMDLWIVGVSLGVLGTMLLGGCILATIVGRRAPGMTMLRLPVFTWTMLVTALMVVASFPALVVAMGLLWVERQFGGIFGSPNGPVAYQHLFWFYGHPVVYVMFFPFLGAVGEVVAVFSGRRFFGYRTAVFALLTFTAISMAVWAHHMFATGRVSNRYFALTSTALLVPAGVEYFDLLATMRRGRIRLRVPMLFALGFIVQFLIGGVTGIFVASPPLDYHVHDSYFVVAHFHYTLFAGSLFGFYAAVYYWFPKATGALLREGLGRAHFWLMALGANLTFFPMFVLGWNGMPRRVADYTPSSGFQTANVISSIGAYVIAISIAVFLANVVVSLRRRDPAGRDPWGGQTLEWATASPPPRHNFDAALPPVRSFAPLLDIRERAEMR
jgi:cytochrome c oxidase subunit 1